MIKIIEKGNRKITKCKYCGCKFSYEDEDLQKLFTDSGKKIGSKIICPQCKSEVVLSNYNS